ncbi:SKA complex subunit 1 [Xiphophorus couchianus]|uniref:SKA complex subunit 1 n=1 Tax=Xiphophorus couchianus TaxID=32473 RepID=UPI0010167ECB|nr:spindle and kinetochore-associated protein 1 [Xiphophorus couchianus]XP_027888854.1 spindle and kinetochore-associated protein 1 [Xiphophorus couchianus]
MADLEEICQHFQNKLSSLQCMLDLSAADFPQQKIKKLGQEVLGLGRILEEFEECVDQQKEQLKQLKELEKLFQNDLESVQHMKDNFPAHIPKRKSPVKDNKPADDQPAQAEKTKKISRNLVKELDYITVQEYESIPQYMKGRVSYEQLNAVVEGINTTVAAKYRILCQPLKALNNHSRKLQQLFKDQETKDTKGQFFVVEEDMREFTQMKVDKRFQGILNMLRHCQRLREVRGGGLVRYVLM